LGNKFPKAKKTNITIPIQKCYLLTRYRNILVKDNSSRKIDMDFLIKSSLSSREYIIKIKYDTIYDIPKVFLLNENLPIYQNEKIPHIYGYKKINGKDYVRLCTYLPEEDWDSKMIIAKTVFLWAIEWIYFFEIWSVSGKWCGRWYTSRRRRSEKSIDN